MNPHIQSLWTAALRSGDYKQATSKLRLGDGFCCLAVLCDLHLKETGLVQSVGDMYVVGGEWNYQFPPEAVVQWAGLEQNNPEVDGSFLTQYNDEKRYSFAEIADVIEEWL